METRTKSNYENKTREIRVSQDSKEHRISELVYLLKDRPVKDIDKMYTIAETVLS